MSSGRVQLGLRLGFLAGVFRDDVARLPRSGANAVDLEAGLGDRVEQLRHLGALEDLVDGDALRRPACGPGRAGRTGGCRFRLLGEVGVEAVVLHEFRAGGFVAEELVGLLVALADAGDVARQLVRLGIVLVEIFGERGAVARDAGAEFFEGGEVLDDLVDLRGGEDVLVVRGG